MLEAGGTTKRPSRVIMFDCIDSPPFRQAITLFNLGARLLSQHPSIRRRAHASSVEEPRIQPRGSGSYVVMLLTDLALCSFVSDGPNAGSNVHRHASGFSERSGLNRCRTRISPSISRRVGRVYMPSWLCYRSN